MSLIISVFTVSEEQLLSRTNPPKIFRSTRTRHRAAYEKFGSGVLSRAEAQRRGDMSSTTNAPFEIPKGWAWCGVDEISLSVGNKNNQILAKEIRATGKWAVVSQGQNLIDGYSDFDEKVIEDIPIILFGDHTRNVKYLDFPFIVGADGTKLIKPLVDGKWLYYWMVYVASKIRNRGYARHWNEVVKLLIHLPPLAEQKRIVARIDELFKVADSLGEAAEGLEEAAKRLDKKILDLAIRGKLVPQDPNDEPASELLKRIVATSHKSPCKNQDTPIEPPFEIPESWEWVRLKELGVFCGGHTPSMSNPNFWNGDILWVSSKDMKSKYITDTQMKVSRLGSKELKLLKSETLLMCTRSGILRRTFPIAIAKRELTINQDQRALTLWLPEMVEYIYIVLKSLETTILLKYKKAGTTVESIIWNKFVDMPIPLPPLAEQKRIVVRVEQLRRVLCALCGTA